MKDLYQNKKTMEKEIRHDSTRKKKWKERERKRSSSKMRALKKSKGITGVSLLEERLDIPNGRCKTMGRREESLFSKTYRLLTACGNLAQGSKNTFHEHRLNYFKEMGTSV